jgi:7,8-dihydropterin-6-yl-methyl-4-(beta-D-ribofuranosyl)aminobenzene 5'-phosphate synthase
MKQKFRFYFSFFSCLITCFHFSSPGFCGNTISLKPVDEVVLLELHGDNNYPVGKSDSLVMRRGDIRFTGKQHPPLEARGMGILVEITVNGKKRTILFDAGSRGDVMRNNFSYFGKNPADIETIVISHGHSDHFGGLPEVLNMIRDYGNPKEIPIYVGSNEAFDTRYFRQKNGDLKGPWRWPKESVERLGGKHILGGPHLLLNGFALYTGPIPFNTSYENINLKKKKGWAVKGDNGSVKMIDMPEEAALVLDLRNRGLVVISGCTHRGIVNTIRYAQQLTGVNSIFARFGSFPKRNKDLLLQDLFDIKPGVFIGAHCSPNRPDIMNTFRTILPPKGIPYYQSVIGSEFHFTKGGNIF